MSAVEVHLSGFAEEAAGNVIPDLIVDMVASGITAQNVELWGDDAVAEATIRLGWVDAVSISRPLVPAIIALRDKLRAAGVTRIVLAGMGGSSLAPEVISQTSGVPLVILDSTSPGQVLDALDGDANGALSQTALVVSSKSGSTVETDSQRRAFEAAFRDLGIDPLERIIVVTDPGSPLDESARSAGYTVFNADPNVGGRYSALTAFGLVPTGLAGVDIDNLLREAESALLEVSIDSVENPALLLAGAIAGSVAGKRKDKLALIPDGTSIVGLPDWIEQLLAESTGKDGTGILPVVISSLSPEAENTPSDVQIVRIVENAVHLRLIERHKGEILVSGSLGAQLVLWEYATVIAGRVLGINPFDQPDVESAKVAARSLLDARPEPTVAAFVENDVEVRVSDASLAASGTIAGTLESLYSAVATDGYISIQAYVNRHDLPQLAGLRDMIAAETGRPVTFGWGPRFLHSTGQYHKGGPAQGAFLQILESSDVDVEIPERPFTFGQLITAQAAGDAAVLAELGRPVVTLTLGNAGEDVLELFQAIDD